MKLKMRYTLKDFKTEYPDDAACLKAVLENRYGNTCPRCGVIGVKWHPITGRKGFVCSECDRHVYPLADTIFRKSETSLWNWFYAIFQFSTHKNGYSAKTLERELGVTYKTAWRMCKQIRLLMAQEGVMLGGKDTPVETDETYAPSRRHPRKLGRSKKQAIFGVVERDGMIMAKHVKSTGARVLIPELVQSVAKDATIYSDEYGSYRSLTKRGYSHTTVNHSTFEYVRGSAHTNTIEGFWGNWKNAISGTYHAVSPKYLQQYVNEFVFRYNHRATAVCPVLLARAARLV
jgi:hypothetical protein